MEVMDYHSVDAMRGLVPFLDPDGIQALESLVAGGQQPYGKTTF